MEAQGKHQMSPTVSRRRLTGGVAWSIPAIAVVASAPLVAASTCPAASFAVQYVDSGDLVTVTNTGSVPIPAETTIIWDLQNVGPGRDLNIVQTSRASLIAGGTGFIDSGATQRVEMVVSTTVVSGGSISWEFNLGGEYLYNSRVTLSFFNTDAATCSDVTGCVSSDGSNTGTSCPGPT